MQLIYGVHPVANAIKSGRARKLILAAGGADADSKLKSRQESRSRSKPQFKPKAGSHYKPAHLYKSKSWQAIHASGLPADYWPRDKFEVKFPGAAHQSCAAECADLRVHSSDYLTAARISQGGAVHKPQPLYLALDGVTDPQNVGACIRSAMAFSCQGLIFPGHNSAALTAACVKASAGMIEWLPLIKVANLSRSLQQLQQQGFWLLSASGKPDKQDSAGRQDRTSDTRGNNKPDKPSNKTGKGKTGRDNRVVGLNAIDYQRPLILLLGSEERGIGRLLLQQSDYISGISIDAQVESLNLSAACAALLHHIRHHQDN